MEVLLNMALGWMCVPMNQLFLIMREISYCFNYLESDYMEALPDPLPAPPSRVAWAISCDQEHIHREQFL